MKYIKLFESTDTIIYYKIEVKKSMDRLNIALDKLGLKDAFYYKKRNEILVTVNFYNIIYLIVRVIGNSILFDAEVSPDDIRTIYDDNIEYGGEIKIEDYEVSANKYNL